MRTRFCDVLNACSSAHGEAYDKGVIHCDVSAGNVLIQIKEKVVDGKLVQKRIGLLTDWELSKRTTASADPRRPHRVVCGSCRIHFLRLTRDRAGNLAIHVCAGSQ